MKAEKGMLGMVRRLPRLCAVMVLLLARSVAPADAKASRKESIRILSVDEHSILIQWTTGQVQFESVQRNGQTCQRVVVPDTVQMTTPGAVQLPTRGALLGLPTAEGVSFQIESIQKELKRGYRLCTAQDYGIGGRT